MALPPSNFLYHVSTHTISWTFGEPNCEFSISYCKPNETTWLDLYSGTDTQCPFNVPSGLYKFRGKARKPGDPNWGPNGTPEDINIA